MPTKISSLTSASTLTGAESVPVVQSGSTLKTLVSAIGTYVRGLFTTTPATIAEGGTNAATVAAARTSLGLGTGDSPTFTGVTVTEGLSSAGVFDVYVTSPAGTNTITAAGPSNFSYAAGAIVRWIPAGTNTGATTINITPYGASALGAKNVFSGGAACVGGELQSGVPAAAMYDGTQFNLIGMYHESYTAASASCTGAMLTALIWRIVKIGNLVTLHVPTTSGAGVATNLITFGTVIPAKYRPISQMSYPMRIIDNEGYPTNSGMLIAGTDGSLKVYKDFTASTNFTVTASAGFEGIAVSWVIY